MIYTIYLGYKFKMYVVLWFTQYNWDIIMCHVDHSQL